MSWEYCSLSVVQDSSGAKFSIKGREDYQQEIKLLPNGSLSSQLQTLGRQNWEMTATQRLSSSEVIYHFKRESYFGKSYPCWMVSGDGFEYKIVDGTVEFHSACVVPNMIISDNGVPWLILTTIVAKYGPTRLLLYDTTTILDSELYIGIELGDYTLVGTVDIHTKLFRILNVNREATHFTWGYDGSGPYALSISLLREAVGEKEAKDFVSGFRNQHISKLNGDEPFILSGNFIRDWQQNAKPDENSNIFKP